MSHNSTIEIPSDSKDDLEYVVHKLQELVGIFNRLNSKKGCTIKSVAFNAETNEMRCDLGRQVTMH